MNTTEEPRGLLWQYPFLLKTFFGACGAHNALNNQQNQYCIDCDIAACQHCLAEGSHVNHRVIKIYRLVYNDVVSLDEMDRHMDCSRIQPYTSNGRLVLALSPLPHHGSGSLKPDIACRFCARRLMDTDRYKFCSIACKFGVDTGKTTIRPKPVQHAPNDSRDPENGTGGSTTDTDTNNKRTKRLASGASRRKGIPVRAPFF